MLRRSAAPLVVGALALWTRAAGRALVFVDGETVPLDGDCHFHMRRALQTLAHFPVVPQRDPWLNWPAGAKAPWGPGFDQLLALPPWLLGLARDPDRAARVIAWVPAALGALVALAAMPLARALEPDPDRRDGAALAAGIVTAAMPTAVMTSAVGRTDHHVAEALCVALAGWWLATAPAGEAPPRGRARFELLGALLVFGSLHVFTGTLMTFALATAVLALRALREARPALLGSGAAAMLGGALLMAAVDGARIRAQDSPFHHHHFSWLPVAMVAIAGVALAVTSAASRRAGPSVARRAALSVLALAPLAGAVALAAPSFRRELAHGLVDWLATRDPWMATVAESLPLLRGGLRGARNMFGALTLAAPLLLALALRRTLRPAPQAARVIALLGGGLLAMTLLQSRFGRCLPALMGAWIALGLNEIVSLAGAAPRRGALPAALAALWVIADPEPRALLAPVRGRWTLGSTQAALFLRRAVPAVAPGARTGVLAHWNLGHETLHLARRPVLVAGFGPYTGARTWAEVEAVWGGDEARALAVMDAHDAGFLLFPAQALLAAGAPRRIAPVKRSVRGALVLDAAYLRAFPLAAGLLGGGGSADLGVAHLAHLRPRFASPDRVAGIATAVQQVWAFERVAGAALAGAAPTGARVVARIPLRVRETTRTWEGWTVAADGRWSLVVPLPSGERGEGGVATGPRYEVTVDGRPAGSAAVSERDVRTGATIPL